MAWDADDFRQAKECIIGVVGSALIVGFLSFGSTFIINLPFGNYLIKIILAFVVPIAILIWLLGWVFN